MNDMFRIDAANIMHEVIEGEVVIVNLENGSYYSLDGAGATIWERLSEGATLDALADELSAQYGEPRETVAKDVAAFVRQLGVEKLVVAGAANGHGSGAAPDASPAPAGGWIAPVVHKYTDMEELLLVDPIHEVEDSGWPNTR